MPITRTPIVDDDGTGTTGTVLDNAWKTELYNQIDAASGMVLFRTAGGTRSGAGDVYLDAVSIPALPLGAVIRITIVGTNATLPVNFWLENQTQGMIINLLPMMPSAGTFAITATIGTMDGNQVLGVAMGFNVAPGVVGGTGGALSTAWTNGWPLGLRWTNGTTTTWRWSIEIIKP